VNQSTQQLSFRIKLAEVQLLFPEPSAVPVSVVAMPAMAKPASRSRPAKSAAVPKPKATADKPKAAASVTAHPPYFEVSVCRLPFCCLDSFWFGIGSDRIWLRSVQMIKEAISALKERTGSSAHAIAKYMGGKYGASLPANYKKMLSIQLRGFAAKGKLVKVKASYKLSDAAKRDSPKAKPAAAKSAPKPAKAAATKPKKDAAAAGTKRKAPEKKKVVAKPKKSPAAKAKAKPKTVKSPASKRARKVAA
jgi:histone H1/5